jgi:putative endonuclease
MGACSMNGSSSSTYWRVASTGLYISVTNDLVRRVHEHREGLLPGFTRKYGVKHLVYYEPYQDVGDAIDREKALKEWRRDWKVALIEQSNPEWTDLYPGLVA